MQKNNLQDIFLTKVRKQSLPVTAPANMPSGS